jgi:predicted adenylyl cyclase CyaB
VKITNVEIKARCTDHQRVREILRSENARFAGEDHQVDTYYRTDMGRLKLRQGKIENALIAYAREDVKTPKLSNVALYKTLESASLKEVLDTALETWIVVDKVREIYFIENLKFHLDIVKGLGSFIEIEAIDDTGTVSEEVLRDQVVKYLSRFDIHHDDLLTHSYSDLLADLR